MKSTHEFKGIRAGDTVLDRLTKKRWLAAIDQEDERIFWLGYPFGGSAHAYDCDVMERADDRERRSMLEMVAESCNKYLATKAREQLEPCR